MSPNHNPGQNPNDPNGDNPGQNPGQNPNPSDPNGQHPDASADEVFSLPPFSRQPRRDAPDGCDKPNECCLSFDLSPRQRRAVPIVASHPTLTAASRAARISQRTLYRWMTDPTFRDAVDWVRRDPVGLCFRGIATYLPRSMEILVATLEHENDELRLEAAVQLIECWFTLEELAAANQDPQT